MSCQVNFRLNKLGKVEEWNGVVFFPYFVIAPTLHRHSSPNHADDRNSDNILLVHFYLKSNSRVRRVCSLIRGCSGWLRQEEEITKAFVVLSPENVKKLSVVRKIDSMDHFYCYCPARHPSSCIRGRKEVGKVQPSGETEVRETPTDYIGTFANGAGKVDFGTEANRI